MNKYQESLNELSRLAKTDNDGLIDSEWINDIELNAKVIQELVDKATPQKPLHRYITVCWSLVDEFRCPTCLNELYFHTDFKPSHCKCGQMLDWNN